MCAQTHTHMARFHCACENILQAHAFNIGFALVNYNVEANIVNRRTWTALLNKGTLCTLTITSVLYFLVRENSKLGFAGKHHFWIIGDITLFLTSASLLMPVPSPTRSRNLDRFGKFLDTKHEGCWITGILILLKILVLTIWTLSRLYTPESLKSSATLVYSVEVPTSLC